MLELFINSQVLNKKLNTAYQKMKIAHQQQKTLFDEFVNMSKKYKENKAAISRIFWQDLPLLSDSFCFIPPMNTELVRNMNKSQGYKKCV